MKFYSPSRPQDKFTLSDAVLGAPSADDLILLPARLPSLPRAVLVNIAEMSIEESAYLILSCLFNNDMPLAELNALVRRTFTYMFPLTVCGDHTYALNLESADGRSIYELEAALYIGLVGTLAPGVAHSFVSMGDGCFQRALRRLLCNGDRRTFIVCPHDRAESTVNSLSGCSSRHICILALAGTTENQASLYKSLLLDREFLCRNHLCVPTGLNPGAYLSGTIVCFASIASLMHHEPRMKCVTAVFDRFDESVVLATAIAKAMGLTLKIYVRRGTGETVSQPVAEALSSFGISLQELFIDKNQENIIQGQANQAAPVVIVNIPPTIKVDMPQEPLRHRFYHVVRNYGSLRRQIEIFK